MNNGSAFTVDLIQGMNDHPRLSPSPLTPHPSPLTPHPSPLTLTKVFTMESRLLVGFEIGAYESPLSLLAQITVDVPIDDATASLAFEILVQCARHYELLRLTPRILASCALYLALKNTQSAPGWSDGLADRCGFSTEVIDQAARHHLHELDGEDLKCRSLASITRERTYAFTLLIKC